MRSKSKIRSKSRTSSRSPKRILIATAGTWGDLLPFVALGQRLASHGHEVTIACASGHHDWVERAGLKSAVFDGRFGKEAAQKQAKRWNQWNPGPTSKPKNEAQYSSLINALERNTLALAHLARNYDLFLSPTNCPEGRLAHELTGTPWIAVIFIPEDASPHIRGLTQPNYVSAMNELFRRLGLNRDFETDHLFKRAETTLFACSRALATDVESGIIQTGFWFYEDPEWTAWRPNPQLTRFMVEGEPPLILSFSSLPLEEPRKVLDVHVRAAQLLKRKLVVQQGWAGFAPELLPSDVGLDQVYMAEFLPHDWFFSRSAGLITHGGIGTLGRALRHSCPVLIEPYGNDQFYNALLMKRLGYGTAVHPHRLSAEGLATVIQEKILCEDARRRLSRAAAIVREEDGLINACHAIERQLTDRGAIA